MYANERISSSEYLAVNEMVEYSVSPTSLKSTKKYEISNPMPSNRKTNVRVDTQQTDEGRARFSGFIYGSSIFSRAIDSGIFNGTRINIYISIEDCQIVQSLIKNR